MTEHDLEKRIEEVRRGTLSRRRFVANLAAAGVAPCVAFHLLGNASSVSAQSQSSASAWNPTRRGGGGPLRLLWWQGPTLLNPHFAVGTKDSDAARLFYEPLASFDIDGNLVPTLAAEIPSREKGTVAADGRSIVWKLKRDVRWHDGKPFTSADVVFTVEWASDPAAAAVSAGNFIGMKAVAIDAHTVRFVFSEPTPFWAIAFCGSSGGAVLPRHLFDAYRGAKSREAPANLRPIGTGPYLFVDFSPGDILRAKINPNYHRPNRPYFDTVEMKGGGDAVSAARAVVQTGEYDYAWNILVEEDILKKMESQDASRAKGRFDFIPAGDLEYILINFSDPWTDVDGERSHPKTKHPIFSDPNVREAINLLVDRDGIQKFIYGRTGIATPNFYNVPERYRSNGTRFEYSVEKANELLDRAGWKPGSDGIRVKDGKPLRLVFQTSVNGPRQKTQAVVKQACRRAGIDIELKAIAASVYFGADVGNPDTNTKFYADLQMYTQGLARPDPQNVMRQFLSSEIASKANKWQGRNYTRWKSDEFDRLFAQASAELDPVKRALLFIKCNDLVIAERVVIPVSLRTRVRAIRNDLRSIPTAFDSDLWAIEDWHRAA